MADQPLVVEVISAWVMLVGSAIACLLAPIGGIQVHRERGLSYSLRAACLDLLPGLFFGLGSVETLGRA